MSQVCKERLQVLLIILNRPCLPLLDEESYEGPSTVVRLLESHRRHVVPVTWLELAS